MLKEVNTNDILEIWLKNFIKIQLSSIQFWYSFFKQTKTIIHLDITEGGLDNINKNLALNFLNSISIGKERSILNEKYPQGFLSYYPNDIFFTWGNRSLKNYLNSYNLKRNIIISGHATMSKKLHHIKSNDLELNNFKKNYKNKLLIIDNMHSFNKSLSGQNIYTPFMENFLEFFIKLVKEDKNYAVLYKIKDKKSITNFQNYNLHDQIKSISDRFIILDDPVNTDPYMFAQFCDLSISINVHLSTSIIENAICGYKSIHYDFMNTEKYEFELYKFGKNKIIFNNFDTFKNELLKYFSNNSIDTDFGNWKKTINKFDPFCDFLGNERIREYITDLKNFYDKNNNKNLSIKLANNNYVKKYGNDKIISYEN